MLCFRPVFIVGLACAVIAIGCRSTEKLETVYREGEPPVSQTASDDPEMKAAIKKAQDTLDDFIEELGKPGDRYFSIKIAMPNSEDSIEHIWAEDVVYKDGEFKAKLANEPLQLPGMKLGDPVEATRDKISDWMIMDGDRMIGGYTAKLLREREARKQ